MSDRLFYQIKQAVLSVVRRPRIFAVAMVTLALGVSVNVLIFQVANEVLLRPLSVADEDGLVTLGNTWEALRLRAHGSLLP